MLVVLERECVAPREEVEHLSEKQEVLAILMEGAEDKRSIGARET